MLDSIITPLSRVLRLSRNQIILIGLVVLVSLMAEGLLVANYVQLTKNIQQNFTPASKLLPQISELRLEVLRLESVTLAALVNEGSDFTTANLLRLRLEDRLRQMQKTSAGQSQYVPSIETTKQLLANYDTLIATYRNTPPGERRSIVALVASQLQAQFRAAEKTLDQLYTAEEKRFTVAGSDAVNTLNTAQVVSSIMALIVLIFGVSLFVLIRQNTQAEFGQASERWSITADIGQAASSPHTLDQLLETTLNLIRTRLGYFAASFYLLDDKGEYAAFKAGGSAAGTYPKEIGYKVLKGSNSIIGYVIANNTHRLTYTYTSEPNFRNEMLPGTHSELAVPLRQNGQVIGALDVQALESYGFTQEDVAIIQTIADQVAVAIGTAAQYTREHRRSQTVTLLAEAFVELTNPKINPDPTDLNGFFDVVRQHVTDAMNVEHIYIALHDTNTTVFEIPYKYDNGQVTSLPSKQLNDDLTSAIIKNRSPLLVNGEKEEAGKTAAILKGEDAAQSFLGVPIIVGDAVVGVLAIQDLNQPGRFNQADEDFLKIIGKQIGVAVQNARLYQQVQRRADQLLAAAEVSRASISVINPDELIVKAAELIRERFNLYYIAVFLVDKGWAVLRYATGSAGEELLKRKHRLEIGGNSMVGTAISRRQARIALDADSEAVRFVNPFLPETHSEMALPLIVGDEVLGALDAQSTKYNAFSESDIIVLQTMADQIAIALENANLINETQIRFNEIATLNQISQAVTAQTDLRTLLDTACQEIARITNVTNVYVALYDEQSKMFEIPYMYEEGQVYTIPPNPLGRGLTGIIIQTRKPLLINNEEDALKLGAIAGGTNIVAQSYLGVPMMAGQNVVGVLAIQDLNQPGRFNESQMRFLETVSAQIAIAIQNTRLFEQTKTRADELAAINRIASAASSALDAPTLLKAVVGEMASIFNATQSDIALRDPSGKSLTVVAAFRSEADAPDAVGSPILLADTQSAQQVIRTQTTLVVNDAQVNPIISTMHGSDVEAIMMTPLIVRGEVIGTVEIDSNLPGKEFTPEDVALAETLSSQIANAIENSRLYQQVQRRADQLLAASEVSRASISITDPEELIVKSVELIRERFNLYYAAMFLVDDVGHWAVLRHATGEAGQELLRRQHRLEIGGRSMVGSAVAGRQARIALDVGVEAVRFANPLLPETHSEMALPLIVGATVIGALDVQSTEYNAFSEADIIVLQTMTDQLATAIQNARLIEETEKALSETRRLANRERTVNAISDKMRRLPNVNTILTTALIELGKSLGASKGTVRVGLPSPETQKTTEL
ncbi:MAG: GAF domain-containing protein [Chloroflexota bacterium]